MRRGLLVALAALALPAAAAAQCPEGAALLGDGSVVEPVGAELRHRGVDVLRAERLDPDCPPVIARLERRGERLLVEIDDGRGRSSRREVSDTSLAATLVETWARREVSAALLRGEGLALRPPEPALAPVEAPRLAEPPVSVLPRATEGRSALTVQVLGEAALGDERSLWGGTAVTARVPAGPVRVLFRGRLSGNPSHTVEERSAARLGADLLAGVALPVTLGRVALAPHLALGGGWMQTSRPRTSPRACGGSVSDGCTASPDALIPDGLRHQTLGGRGEAGLGVSIAMRPRLWLDVEAATTFAPWAHRDSIVPSYAALLDESMQAQLAVPGEPWITARLGVGLRFAP